MRPSSFAKALATDSIRSLWARKGLPPTYLDDLAEHVAPLAATLVARVRDKRAPLLLGLNGSQGSGKSTLAQFIVTGLQLAAGLRCCTVSIDDVYLDRARRQELARDVHPLLITRGVPGTHDLALANLTLDALLDPGRTEDVRVPVFDKAIDDRAPLANWSTVPPGVELVILEGWCVGCTAQPHCALAEPVNALERDEDSDGRWRRYVNERLATDYRDFFARLDMLFMLAAPDFERVYQWRRQQERQLETSLRASAEAAPTRILSDSELLRFISHYERLTRHQIDALPALADAVITLGTDHRMTGHGGG